MTPPQGPALALDGVMDAEEWQGALSFSLGGDGQVFFMARGEALSVGVRGPSHGLAHLALNAGDTVWVLHASAGLGSGVYTRLGDQWDKVQDPTWEVRDPTLSQDAVGSREDYLANHGWVGTTGRMGQEGEIEFLLRPGAFNGGPLRLAVAFLTVGQDPTALRWPASATDDAALMQLLTGPMPQTLRFDPSAWGWVVMRQDDP